MIQLNVNGKVHQLDVAPDTPLLWALRDTLHMTGTKYGCGQALCGACTIHLDGEAVRSCVTPVSNAAGKQITTIEGLSEGADGPESIGKRLQQAWLDENTPQCGYCQSGQIMSAAVLLRENPHPTEADVNACMSGNLCRCGTYLRIRAAIQRAANLLGGARK